MSINSGCPQGVCEYPIGVIVCEDKADMLKVERETHKQFKAYRANGEWFELVDEISEHIQEFTDTESGKAFLEEDRENYRENHRENHRERYQKDPEYRESHLERSRVNRKSPEYRERRNKHQRERYQKDPEYRENYRERNRKHRKDPEYRKRDRESQRERRKDPEYRERENKRRREKHARKKREKQPINGQQLQLF